MRVLLVVQREGDATWVTDAVDEYTWDEVGLPDDIAAKFSDPAYDLRMVWVELPHDNLDHLWDIPSTEGTLTPEAGDG